MTKPKTPHPVSSYSPNLQDALRKGMRGPYEIPFKTEREAIAFTHRIHGLRAAMRREGHPDWEQTYRVGVYPHPTDPKIRIVRPRHSEFDTALREAGVDLTDDGTSTTAPPRSTSTPAPDITVDDLLADLRKKPTLDDL